MNHLFKLFLGELVDVLLSVVMITSEVFNFCLHLYHFSASVNVWIVSVKLWCIFCCSLQFCRQPCSLGSNSLSKWGSWKEFTLFPPHSQVLTAPSNKSPSAFTGQDRCCQICRDGERLCKRAAGSEESHKSIKMPQSAPCYFGTVNWGHCVVVVLRQWRPT